MNVRMKRDPLNPGLRQRFNFSKAYLEKSPDDQIVPGKEKKTKQHEKERKTCWSKMNL